MAMAEIQMQLAQVEQVKKDLLKLQSLISLGESPEGRVIPLERRLKLLLKN
ncbi:hypothetical protein Desgi_4202 [Desulfoscipio gibsoniae DSM 7213]|uniref:Uncharacterized protein n=1 Tax=Desulfoscipio gibsoniae DSM 7213 TaxID=767817 RepID=R4KS85_9FIRM|nr:hypothetical protein Desgi_4202 [Desulfoscipio gibsoniae DSM 7213]